MTISLNIQRINADISAYKDRPITFVAVTKSVGIKETLDVINSGVMHIGENRLNVIDEKYSEILKKHPDVKWHYIGHIQRNKAKKVVSCSDYIHSVDSVRLIDVIDKCCKEQGKTVKVFLEVNVSGEQQKHGFTPDDLLEKIDDLVKYKNLDIIGLMTMAPYLAEENILREVFGGLRKMRDKLLYKGYDSIKELSMGMSLDYRIALEEGATFIRVGSSIFG